MDIFEGQQRVLSVSPVLARVAALGVGEEVGTESLTSRV